MGTTQQHGGKRGGRDALWRWLDRWCDPAIVRALALTAGTLIAVGVYRYQQWSGHTPPAVSEGVGR